MVQSQFPERSPLERGAWSAFKRSLYENTPFSINSPDAVNPLSPIPFVSSVYDAAETSLLAGSANAIKKALDSGAEPDPVDVARVKGWQEREQRDAERYAGMTRNEKRWKNVGKILTQLPGFAGELAATGGIATAGRALATKAAAKLAGEASEQLAKRLSMRIAGGVAGAAAQTVPAAGIKIASGTVAKMMPSLNFSEDERGIIDATVGREGDGFLEALYKSAGDNFIEVLSERSGGFVTGLFGKGGKWIAKKVPQAALVTGLKRQAVEHMLKKFPDLRGGKLAAKLDSMKTAAQWHGLIGEMLEERLGEIGRAGMGLEPYKFFGVEPGKLATEQGRKDAFDQFLTESIAFSIPGLGGAGLNYTANKLDKLWPKDQQPTKGQMQALVEALQKRQSATADQPPVAGVAEPPSGLAGTPVPAMAGKEPTIPSIRPKKQRPVVPETSPEEQAAFEARMQGQPQPAQPAAGVGYDDALNIVKNEFPPTFTKGQIISELAKRGVTINRDGAGTLAKDAWGANWNPAGQGRPTAAAPSQQPAESEAERYAKLSEAFQASIRNGNPDLNVWRQIEDIKNRNGGMPPLSATPTPAPIEGEQNAQQQSPQIAPAGPVPAQQGEPAQPAAEEQAEAGVAQPQGNYPQTLAEKKEQLTLTIDEAKAKLDAIKARRRSRAPKLGTFGAFDENDIADAKDWLETQAKLQGARFERAIVSLAELFTPEQIKANWEALKKLWNDLTPSIRDNTRDLRADEFEDAVYRQSGSANQSAAPEEPGTKESLITKVSRGIRQKIAAQKESRVSEDRLIDPSGRYIVREGRANTTPPSGSVLLARDVATNFSVWAVPADISRKMVRESGLDRGRNRGLFFRRLAERFIQSGATPQPGDYDKGSLGFALVELMKVKAKKGRANAQPAQDAIRVLSAFPETAEILRKQTKSLTSDDIETMAQMVIAAKVEPGDTGLKGYHSQLDRTFYEINAALERHGGLAPEEKNRLTGYIFTADKYAKYREKTGKNKTTKLSVGFAMDFLSKLAKGEIGADLNAQTRWKLVAFFQFQALTGGRKKDLQDARWGDIDRLEAVAKAQKQPDVRLFAARTAKVEEAKGDEDLREYAVVMTRPMVALMERLRQSAPENKRGAEDFIWAESPDDPFYRAAEKVFSEWKKKATPEMLAALGVDKLRATPHQTWRTTNANLLASGLAQSGMAPHSIEDEAAIYQRKSPRGGKGSIDSYVAFWKKDALTSGEDAWNRYRMYRSAIETALKSDWRLFSRSVLSPESLLSYDAAVAEGAGDELAEQRKEERGKEEEAFDQEVGAATLPQPGGRFESAEIFKVPLSMIEVRNDLLPQFKANADPKTGVVRGKEIKGPWRQMTGEAITLWLPKGASKFVVVTGRHRFDLAKRENLKTIDAQILLEEEGPTPFHGWSAKKALVFDAESNILGNQGELEDYVNYFEAIGGLSREEAEARGLLRDIKGRRGYALARLASDDLRALWRAAKIDDASAAAIAEAAPENAIAQKAASEKYLQRKAARKTISAAELQVLAKDAASDLAESRARGEQADQMDMFGGTEIGRKWEARAGYVADKIDALKDFIASRRPLIRRFETATSTGTISAEKAKVEKEVADAEALLSRWEEYRKHDDLRAEVEQAISGDQGPAVDRSAPKRTEAEQFELLSISEREGVAPKVKELRAKAQEIENVARTSEQNLFTTNAQRPDEPLQDWQRRKAAIQNEIVALLSAATRMRAEADRLELGEPKPTNRAKPEEPSWFSPRKSLPDHLRKRLGTGSLFYSPGSWLELMQIFDDPDIGIPEPTKRIIRALLESGFAERLPMVKLLLVDYVSEHGSEGSYTRGQKILQLYRWTQDPELGAHELFHHVYDLLPDKYRDLVKGWHRDALIQRLATTKDSAEISAIHGILSTMEEGTFVTSDQAIERDYPEDIYHLTNDSEFFVWLMLPKAKEFTERNEAAHGFVQHILDALKAFWHALVDAAGDALNIAPSEDRLWRDLLSGKIEYLPDSSRRAGKKVVERSSPPDYLKDANRPFAQAQARFYNATTAELMKSSFAIVDDLERLSNIASEEDYRQWNYRHNLELLKSLHQNARTWFYNLPPSVRDTVEYAYTDANGVRRIPTYLRGEFAKFIEANWEGNELNGGIGIGSKEWAGKMDWRKMLGTEMTIEGEAGSPVETSRVNIISEIVTENIASRIAKIRSNIDELLRQWEGTMEFFNPLQVEALLKAVDESGLPDARKTYFRSKLDAAAEIRPDTLENRVVRARMVARIKEELTGEKIDMAMLTPDGAQYIDDLKRSLEDLRKELEKKSKSNPEAAKRAEQIRSLKDRNVELEAARATLENETIKEVFVKARDKARSIADEFRGILFSFKDAFAEGSGNLVSSTEKGRIAQDLRAAWENLQQQKNTYLREADRRSAQIKDEIGKVEDRINRLYQAQDEVDFFLSKAELGRDIIDPVLQARMRELTDEVKRFAERMANSRRWPNRSPKQIVMDLLLGVDMKDVFDRAPVGAERASVNEPFGITRDAFDTIIRALKESPEWNDAVVVLIDHYEKQNKAIFKPRAGGINILQAQETLQRIAALGRARKADGTEKTEDERKEDTATRNAILGSLRRRASEDSAIRAKTLDRMLQTWTTLNVQLEAYENGKRLFKSVEDDPDVPNMIKAAEEAVGGLMQEMILSNDRKITLKKVGEITQDIEIEPSMMNASSFNAVKDYTEKAEAYVAEFQALENAGVDPEKMEPTPDRPYRYDRRQYRGLQAFLAEFGHLTNDSTQIVFNPKFRTNKAVQWMLNFGAFRQFLAYSERVFGVQGRWLQHRVIAHANVQNAVNAVFHAHNNRIYILRSKALRSHPELKNVMDDYRELVLNPLASEGRKFSYAGSADKPRLRAEMLLPTSGIKVTKEDLAYIKAVENFTQALSKRVSEIQAGRGTREKGPDGNYYIRRPQPVGDISTQMTINSAGRNFIKRITEAYNAAEHQKLPVSDESVDLTGASENPIAKFWNERLELVISHILDAGREYRNMRHADYMQEAEQSLGVLLRQSGKHWREVLPSVRTLDDIIDVLYSGTFYETDPKSTHFPQNTGQTRDYVKRALLSELEQYNREANSMASEPPDKGASVNLKDKLTLDSEFTSPAARFRLPSALYDFGLLSDLDFSMAGIRAVSDSVVDLFYALDHAASFLDEQTKRIAEGKVKEGEADQPGSLDEIRKTAIAIRKLRKDLELSHDMSDPEVRDRNNADWPPSIIKASLLASPYVNIRNVVLGGYLAFLRIEALNRFNSAMGLLQAARHVISVGRGFAVSVLLSEHTGITRGARKHLLNILDKEILPLSKLIADQWIRGHFDRMEKMQAIGLSRRLPFRETLRQYFLEANEAKDNIDLQRRSTPWGKIVRNARLAKQATTLGFRAIGAEFSDLLINAQSILFTQGVTDTIQKEAIGYGERRKALDPQKFAEGYKAGDEFWMLKPDEWSHRLTSGGRKKNLAEWYKFLNRANLNLDYLLWKSYLSQTKPETQNASLSDNQLDALRAAFAREVNAGDMSNRFPQARHNWMFRMLSTFQGYSFNFITQWFLTLRGTYGMTRAETWINNIGLMVYLAIGAAMFGLFSSALVEKAKKHLLKHTGTQLTLFDPEFYKWTNAKEGTINAMLSSLGLIGEIPLYAKGQIVNNRGYEPTGRVLGLSIMNDLFNSVRGLYNLRHDPAKLHLPLRDLFVKYTAYGRETAVRLPGGYSDVRDYKQAYGNLTQQAQRLGYAPDRSGNVKSGINYTPTYGMREDMISAMMDRDSSKLTDAYLRMVAYYQKKGLDKPEQAAIRELHVLHPATRGMGGKKPTQEQMQNMLALMGDGQRKSVYNAINAWEWAANQLGTQFTGYSGQRGTSFSPITPASATRTRAVPRISPARFVSSGRRPSIYQASSSRGSAPQMSRIAASLRRVRTTSLRVPKARTKSLRSKKVSIRRAKAPKMRRISIRSLRTKSFA